MKRFLCVLCAVLLCCFLTTACSNTDKLQISASDIAKAELIVQPSSENERYKLINENDYGKIVELLSNVPNKSISDPESIVGGAETLYLTLTDGTVHTLCNDGNVYIVLDETRYKMTKGFSSLWKEYGFDRGNAEVPDDFKH